MHGVTAKELLDSALEPKAPLLLELIAIKPIRTGDEILLDYGPAWSAAWKNHVDGWKPPITKGAPYIPSYVLNDAIRQLRIPSELKLQPYPDNVYTVCLYQYQAHQKEVDQARKFGGSAGVTAYAWKATLSRIFHPQNLRPCTVVQRDDEDESSNEKKITTYTVQIKNRVGLSEDEVIPKEQLPFLVSKVPRQAIRFADKVGTTDPYLPGAFRHFIDIPDDVFPDSWKDEAKTTTIQE